MSLPPLSVFTSIRNCYVYFGKLNNKSSVGRVISDVVGPKYIQLTQDFSRHIVGLHPFLQTLPLIQASERFLAQLAQNGVITEALQKDVQELGSKIQELFVKCVNDSVVEEAEVNQVSTLFLEQMEAYIAAPSAQPNFYKALHALIVSLYAGDYGAEMLERFQNALFVPNELLFLLTLLDHLEKGGKLYDLEPFVDTSEDDAIAIQQVKIARDELIRFMTQKNDHVVLPEQTCLMKVVSSALKFAEDLLKGYWEYLRAHFHPSVDDFFQLACRGANLDEITRGFEPAKRNAVTSMMRCLLAITQQEMKNRLLVLGKNRSRLQLVLRQLALHNHPELSTAFQYIISVTPENEIIGVTRDLCAHCNDIEKIANTFAGQHAQVVKREVAYFLLAKSPEVALPLYFRAVPTISETDLDIARVELEGAFQGTVCITNGVRTLQTTLSHHQFLCSHLQKGRGHDEAMLLLSLANPKAKFEKRLFEFMELHRIYNEESESMANRFYLKQMANMDDRERFMLILYAQLLNVDSILPVVQIILSQLESSSRELELSYFFLVYEDSDSHLEGIKSIQDIKMICSIIRYWIAHEETLEADLLETIIQVLDCDHVKKECSLREELLIELLQVMNPDSDYELFWELFSMLVYQDSQMVVIKDRYLVLGDMSLEREMLPLIVHTLFSACERKNIDEILGISQLLQNQLQDFGYSACLEALTSCKQYIKLLEIENYFLHYTGNPSISVSVENVEFYFVARCLADIKFEKLLDFIEPSSLIDEVKQAFKESDRSYIASRTEL